MASTEPDELMESIAAIRAARRINVVGTSGTGKTTFAGKLAAVLEVPHLEMDRLYWQPGWKGRENEAFLALVKDAVSGSRWILDGNYSRTVPLKWARTECVVWLDYSFSRTSLACLLKGLEEIYSRSGNMAWNRQS